MLKALRQAGWVKLSIVWMIRADPTAMRKKFFYLYMMRLLKELAGLLDSLMLATFVRSREKGGGIDSKAFILNEST